MSVSKSSKLEALKNAYDTKAKTGGASDQNWKLKYQFWKMPTDATAVIRFLPDKDPDNSLGFLIENLTHELYVNGKKTDVPCAEMHGNPCPICDLSRSYYKQAEDAGESFENQGPLTKLGKSFYRKKSYIGQAIVIESPIEHDQAQLVKLIEIGPAIFTQIQAAFKSGDLEEAPYEFKGGYHFRIKKTQNGKHASYSTSSFAPKQTDLDDDVIEAIELYNLADFRGKKMDTAAIEALLVAAQTGQVTEESVAEHTTSSAEEVVAAVESVATEAVENVASSESQPAITPKGSALLQKLRDREAAAKK